MGLIIKLTARRAPFATLACPQAKTLEVMREHYKCQPQDGRYEAFLQEKIANAYTYATNAPAIAASPGSKVFAHLSATIIRASAIEEKPTHWLWYPYLPAGSISLLAGRGGDGKGLVSASLATVVTTGGAWPCSTEHVTRGNVLWCEAEDDLARTLKPRWTAAGADCDRIDVVTPKIFAELDLKTHVRNTDTRLIVFSPMITFLKGLEDINAELNVRAALALVQEAIEDTDCAMLGIVHLNKKGDLPTIERVLGSVAFTNFVRSVAFVVCEDRDAEEYRLVHAKHNLSKKGADLLYSPEDLNPGKRSQRVRVNWSVPDANVDAAVIYDRKKSDRKPTAREWLISFLIANGETAKDAVIEAAKTAHFSADAIDKAHQREKRCKGRTVGFPGKALWCCV